MRARRDLYYGYLKIVIACAALVSVLPATARTSVNYLNMSLEELTQVVVTSSTLTEESLKTVPASISIFTRQQIQQLGVNTLEELMNYAPGYQSYLSDMGGITYSSRSRRVANGNREVLILLNGQRLIHDALGVSSFTDGDLPVDNIERVEFLRGPGSAIYGANAFMGVINIITPNRVNNASVSGGNNFQQRASVNLNHEFENGLQASLFAHSSRANNGQSHFYDAFSKTTVDDTQQKSNADSMYLRANWADWSLHLRHVDRLVQHGYSLGNVSDKDSLVDSYSDIYALHYSTSVNEQWKFNSRLYKTPYEIIVRGKVAAAGRISNLIFAGNESGIENHLQWQEGSANALIGADFSRYAMDNALAQSWLLTPDNSFVSAPSQLKMNRYLSAVYGQWQHAITTELNYILGVRYDDYSDVKNYTSPRLGLIWQQSNNSTFKLLYGEAFRAPARNELYLRNNSTQQGNPDLHPEYSRTAELIWTYSKENHYFTASLFNTDILDSIASTNTIPRQFVNFQKQRLNGLELEYKWELTDEWQAATTLSHIFDSDVAINPDAEDLASISIIYNRDAMMLSLSSRYHGEVRDQDSSTLHYHSLGGYTLIDAHAKYQLTPEWGVYANLRNLTNKYVLQPATQNINNTIGVAGTGREIELGVHWDF
ncbi:MAG: TonB-dependent receptor [Pseudomonadota bacterium]